MITLSSDFGWPYPAAMRGVIAAESDARMVDITHAFPRGNVHTTAFWLREVLPWFPPAVHLVVVDPGVGTERDVLAIEAGEHVLVGPDNGVLIPVARHLDAGFEAYRLTDMDAASQTFHGRDVFAPLAARVHDASIEALDTLEPASDIVEYRFPKPTIEGTVATGEVLVVDGFGNVITNIPGGFGEFGMWVTVNGERVPVVRTYAAVDRGEPIVTVGSHGNLELAVHDGRGADAFGVSPGSSVRISKE